MFYKRCQQIVHRAQTARSPLAVFVLTRKKQVRAVPLTICSSRLYKETTFVQLVDKHTDPEDLEWELNRACNLKMPR